MKNSITMGDRILNKYVLLLMLSITPLLSCEKQEVEVDLPESDGHVYFLNPKKSKVGISVQGKFSNGQLQITGHTKGDKITLHIDTVGGIIGTYTFTANDQDALFELLTDKINYTSKGMDAGTLTISSYDRQKGTTSGSFSVTLKATNNGEIHHFIGHFHNVVISAFQAMELRYRMNGEQVLSTIFKFSFNNDRLVLSGTDDLGQTLTLTLSKVKDKGPHPITLNGDNIGTFRSGPSFSDPTYRASSGQVNILEIDRQNKVIKGNFHFTHTEPQLPNNANISNGSFQVPF